jgi:hypothetical protein
METSGAMASCPSSFSTFLLLISQRNRAKGGSSSLDLEGHTTRRASASQPRASSVASMR